jgi:hypothetical protein
MRIVLASAALLASSTALADVPPDVEVGLAVGSIPLGGAHDTEAATGPNGNVTARLALDGRHAMAFGNRLRVGIPFARWQLAIEGGGLWPLANVSGAASVDGTPVTSYASTSMLGAALVIGGHVGGRFYQLAAEAAFEADRLAVATELPTGYACRGPSPCVLGASSWSARIEPRARGVWRIHGGSMIVAATIGTDVLDVSAWRAAVTVGWLLR